MTTQERRVAATQIARRRGCTVEEAARALLQVQDDAYRAMHYLRFQTRVR